MVDSRDILYRGVLSWILKRQKKNIVRIKEVKSTFGPKQTGKHGGYFNQSVVAGTGGVAW